MAYTTIDDPSAYFQTTLYAGDGNGSGQAITHGGNSDLQADFIWIKNRTDAENHSLTDSVRGANKGVLSNSSDAESTDNSNGYLSSFNSDGFTTANAGVYNNASSKNYVSWNWKAGGSSSTNTDGSQNTTVSVNTTAGFSIVKWTGADSTGSLGHGLGAVPKMIIAKRLATRNWTVYHVAMGANKKLFLNTNAAETSIADFDATPTSSVINVGYTDDANGSGSDYIGYVFAEKQGYSKFGSYTGNGNADGPMIWTGFKPAFIMYKNTARAISWLIHDNKRLGYNPDNDEQHPDTNATDGTDDRADILSNGFKIRESSNLMNVSGEQVIYMAFAENPFVTSSGVPATAR